MLLKMENICINQKRVLKQYPKKNLTKINKNLFEKSIDIYLNRWYTNCIEDKSSKK